VSRYRPPTTPGSKYITPEGAKRLRDELDRLWLTERPRVTLAVSEAAAQGDRSENAEYTYGKKWLHEIDRRVRFLRKRLEGMTVVASASAAGADARRDPSRVYFGAWVQLEQVNRERRWYRLVGPDEFDMAAAYLSMDSPLGRSLLGKRQDDEITVALPAGPTQLTIVAVHYGVAPPDDGVAPPDHGTRPDGVTAPEGLSSDDGLSRPEGGTRPEGAPHGGVTHPAGVVPADGVTPPERS
jgi:transcription elongation factor GreB